MTDLSGSSASNLEFSQFKSIPAANMIQNSNFESISAVGPVSLGQMVTLTSTDPNAVIGNDFYQLGSNGQFTPAANGFAALNDISGDSVFHFGNGPVARVGAFLNYSPDLTPPDVTLTALDSSGNVLQSYDLNTVLAISTPNGVNATAFRGITSSSADIAAFEVSNGSVAVSGLSFSVVPAAATPEPASLTLLSMGLLGLFGRRPRRKR